MWSYRKHLYLWYEQAGTNQEGRKPNLALQASSSTRRGLIPAHLPKSRIVTVWPTLSVLSKVEAPVSGSEVISGRLEKRSPIMPNTSSSCSGSKIGVRLDDAFASIAKSTFMPLSKWYFLRSADSRTISLRKWVHRLHASSSSNKISDVIFCTFARSLATWGIGSTVVPRIFVFERVGSWVEK